MRWRTLVNSFRYAWSGIRTVFHEERNFRLQIGAMLLALALGWFLHVHAVEMAILVLVSSIVLVLELLNSVIERVVDMVKPRLHPYVAEIKNIAAGAVLLAACMAIVVALYIFAPYLRRHL